jgi:hypothetical protein
LPAVAERPPADDADTRARSTQARNILQPLCVAVFFSYLLRPLINMLRTPYAQCCPCVPRARSDRVGMEATATRGAGAGGDEDPEEKALLHSPVSPARAGEVEAIDCCGVPLRRCPRWLAVVR